MIGIEGRALEWFKNYLTGRHFQVLVKDTKSALKLLDKGVPQGSVLGPILFCIYSIYWNLLGFCGNMVWNVSSMQTTLNFISP